MARDTTAPTQDVRFDMLHALRVKGYAAADTLASTIGVPSSTVETALADFQAEGFVELREGRISGWRLTAAGTAVHADALARRSADTGTEGATRLHHAFVPLNGRVKELCTAWQLRDGAINDHTDQAYDRSVTDDAAALQVDVDRMLGDAASMFSRTGWYRPRLQAAHERFAAGDGQALARPLSASYHDVWMELHQDLILTLGLTRTDADA